MAYQNIQLNFCPSPVRNQNISILQFAGSTIKGDLDFVFGVEFHYFFKIMRDKNVHCNFSREKAPKRNWFAVALFLLTYSQFNG